MSRWVRIQADVFDHTVFAPEPYSEREAWIWLISKAAWKETRHRVGNTMATVPVGSLFVTLRELQDTWGWGSDYRVRTFLKLLQAEGMISVNGNAGKTQVTICNYSRYQNPDHEENAAKTQAERTENALNTPVHQYTTSSLRSEGACAPEKNLEFSDFWSIYPNKVGKRVAEAAFSKARKRADFETILAGLRRYVAKTDDRPWCNPATWLNQDRWDDAPAEVPQSRSASPPPGRRMNAVEAYLSMKSEQSHEPASRTIDHRNDELLPTDEPRLQALTGQLGQALRWPDGSSHH